MATLDRRSLLATLASATTFGISGCAGVAYFSEAPLGDHPARSVSPMHDLLLVGTAALMLKMQTLLRSPGGTYAINAETGALAWQIEDVVLAGEPVAREEAIYLPCETPTGPKDEDSVWEPNYGQWGGNEGRIIATSPDTGEILWSVTDKEQGFRWVGFVNGQLYALTDGNRLHSVDPDSGDRAWIFTDLNEVGGFPAAQRYPAVHEDILALTAGEQCWGIAADTGDLSWTYDGLEGSMNDTASGEEVLYVADHDGVIHAIDISTGETVWAFGVPSTFGRFGTARPRELVLNGDVLFAWDSNDTVWALNAATGNRYWRTTVEESPYGAFTVTEDTIYVGTRETIETESPRERTTEHIPKVVAIDRRTGEERWQFDQLNGQQIHDIFRVGDVVGITSWVGPESSFVLVDTTSGELQYDLSTMAGGFQRLGGDDSQMQLHVTTRDPPKLIMVDVANGGSIWEFSAIEYPAIVDPAFV